MVVKSPFLSFETTIVSSVVLKEKILRRITNTENTVKKDLKIADINFSLGQYRLAPKKEKVCITIPFNMNVNFY